MMSILFMIAFIGVLPLFFGILFQKLMKKKELGRIDLYLTGTLLFFALFEIVGIAAVKLNFSLDLLMTMFAGGCSVLLLLSLFWCRRTVGTVLSGMEQSMRFRRNSFLMIVLFLLIGSVIWIYQPYHMADTMEETVRTTLATNALFEYNPLTGEQMTNGMYPINQLATLPLFYATLSSMAELDVSMLLDWIVPVWVLFLHLGVMWLWGRKRNAKDSFLLWYALILLFTVNEADALGFALLHQGYLGNTILIMVVIPYALYWIVTWLENAKKRTAGGRDWIYAALMLLMTGMTAACVTNLKMIRSLFRINSYSMGIMLVLLLLRILQKSHEKIQKEHFLQLGMWVLCLVTGYWMPLAAYAITEITSDEAIGRYKLNKSYKKITCIGAVVLVILGQGVWCYGTGDAVLRDGSQTAEEGVVDKLIALAADLTEGGQTDIPADVPTDGQADVQDKNIRLAAPHEIMELIRKETAAIDLPYGRDYWTPHVNDEIGDIYNDVAYSLYANIVTMESQGDLVDPEVLILVAGNARLNECSLLVTTAEMDLEQITRAVFLEEINGYYIYHMLQ